MRKPALLALADGRVFKGESIGAEGSCVGELVFNTSMTGYQEMLTDPSYTKQIITLTMPHVGNTGCNREDMESSRVWAQGLVVRDCSLIDSSYRSELSLPAFLRHHGVVALSGVDTRQITLDLRTSGAIGACITTDTASVEKAIHAAKIFPGLTGMDLASEVSRKTIERWEGGRKQWGKASEPARFHVVAYDFGVKHSLLRILQEKGCHITLVPATTTAQEVFALKPDGIFLSNGPGDPKACEYAIAATREFIEAGIALLGICLGFQILGLALGASSYKMKFGHHGANHPVLEIASNRVYITSQNHGFALEEAGLPACLEITHRSLFDQSLQGIAHKTRPALGFQGHPEASPGPHDMENLFDTFIEFLKASYGA